MSAGAAGAARRDGVAGHEASGAASGIPGWVLRVALGAAAAAATGISMAAAPQVGVLTVAGIAMMLLVLGTSLAPATVTPLLLLLGLVIYRVLAPGPVLDASLAALVLLLPLIHQIAGIAAVVPPRSHCRWQVLRPAALRYLTAVIPVALALLAAAFWI